MIHPDVVVLEDETERIDLQKDSPSLFPSGRQ